MGLWGTEEVREAVTEVDGSVKPDGGVVVHPVAEVSEVEVVLCADFAEGYIVGRVKLEIGANVDWNDVVDLEADG